MEAKKKSWTSALFAYAEGEKSRLLLSVVLSVLSVMLGLVPFYCMYRLICLMAAGTATAALAVKWCLLALAAYAAKVVLFGLSTGTSHAMAYTILEGLRLRLADRFLHAPLGNVENHTIGEVKTMMVDKIETLEPPLAHMIPEGAGHVVLPVVSIIALLCVDWRLALASLVTFPLSFLCMGLTFKISGKNFDKYDQSASAITDFRTFVVKWLASTFATMKLSFALFPSTLIGTLPVALALANKGVITAPEAALAVMLSISMVGSLAKLEVFSENMRQVKFTVEGLEKFLKMPELSEPAERAEITHTDVALKDVRFSYTGKEKDEVLHGIDPENEHLIQQAISALTRGKTIITIAHRLATVQNADQILVVDDGRIAQHGTHDQLVKQEGLYRRFTAIRQQAEGWRIAAEQAFSYAKQHPGGGAVSLYTHFIASPST